LPVWLPLVALLTQVAAPSATPADVPKVFLSCAACDRAKIASAITFVAFVPDETAADLTTSIEVADRRWTVTFTGRGRFANQNRTIAFDVSEAAAADAVQSDLERFLKLGLVDYSLSTPKGADVDVSFTRPGAGTTTTAQPGQHDPWNYWVFRVGADSYGSGEASTSNRSVYLNSSATRTTENWKIRVSFSRSLDTSSFIVDETETIKTRLTDWNVNPLIVKSLGPHWSAALTSTASGSSFSNVEFGVQAMPGIEYDIFPYSESSRRSLTLQYNVGGAHYRYEELTIYNKLSESITQHSAAAFLGLRQPWGSAGGSATFNQQLTSPERTRLSLNGNLEVRVLKSLTINAFGQYSRIRDQTSLEKGDASEEEVLLRQRALATGYRYSFRVGLSYSFGAVWNTTVNPRFGG